MKKTYVIIQADMNDADYCSSKNLLETEEEIKIVERVAAAIKSFKPYKSEDKKWTHHHNWPAGENSPREDLGEKSPKELYVDSGKITEEEYDFFSDITPHGEYGIHTIESIELLTVTEERELL